MLLHSWLDSFTRKHRRSQCRAYRRAGPTLNRLPEALEDRCLLSFGTPANYPVGVHNSVVTADVNGDQRLDLVTANHDSNSVSVLLGKADGTFQAAQSSATGYSPRSVAVGDFNSDGKLDLVTANAGDLSILLGNGNGTFQPPTSVTLYSPSSVAVGDFNNDGKLDLGATSNTYYPGSNGYYGWYPGWFSGSAHVLLGNGSGSFSSPAGSTKYYSYYSSAVVGDFNSDGKQDLAAIDTQGYSVSLHMGTGTGALGEAISFSAGYYPQSMMAGDVNADSKLDLVVATSGSNVVSVLLGTGSGSFAATQTYPTGIAPSSVAIADFNGDGKKDLVAANVTTDSVSVLLGTGTGAFRPPVNASTGVTPSSVAVGDFNGDGRQDAVTASSSSTNLSVLLNDGTWPSITAPLLSINDVAVTEGNTGTLNATFTVTLSAASSVPVTVQYLTSDGNATVADNDYQLASNTLTFEAGQVTKTISVIVNSDRRGEYNEVFNVQLSNPTNAYIDDGTGVATILNDEPAIYIGDSIIKYEGNTGTTAFSFAVTLSAPYDAPVTVGYTTIDLSADEEYWYGTGAKAGVDYVFTAGTLTFGPGEVSNTVTVQVLGDRVGEYDEVFFFQLSNPTSSTLSSTTATGTIVNDEPFVSFASNGAIVEGNSGAKNATFTLTLSAAYDAPVTVNFATGEGSATAGQDFVATAGTVTINPGLTSQLISVPVIGDTVVEYDEYFYVELTSSSGGTLTSLVDYVYIVDDDTPPTISISDAWISEGNSGTSLMNFTVSLSQVSSKVVTVKYATANNSAKVSDNDYTAKSGTLTFASGEISKTISIVIRGDTRKESDETLYLNLSAATNAAIADHRGIGTIANDDGRRGHGRKCRQASINAILDLAFEDLWSDRPKKRRL